jgi:cell division protein FtsQ
MPRMTASRELRPAPAPRSPRAAAARKPKKPAAMQDRLSARALFLRRVRRSIKPGLWILGGLVTLAIGSEIFRAIPEIGPVLSPAGSVRHDFGAAAAMLGFRVATVQIDGADTTPLPVIQAALGVRQGDPILGFSLQNAEARIEQLGPIQSAVVERALPGTIIITVKERAPYAVWQTAGSEGSAKLPKFVVIDKSGNIIADQDAVAAKRRNPMLLLLTGQDAPQMAGALMNELIAFPQVRSRVAAAQRIDGLRWNLILRNNTVVKLPEDNDQKAIADLARMQDSIALLDRPVEVIDLRLAGRMAVRPYPNAAPPASGTGASALGAAAQDHT